MKRLPAFRISPPCPSVLPPPVNPRLSAHASFIMPGLPLQDPAHAPPLPPGLSGRGRTNPSRKGCDALRPRVSAQSPSRSIRTVPGISQTGRPSAAFPSPPIPRGLLLMPPAAPSARPREEGPGVPEENAEEPRNSPVPQKMKRGDGEEQGRPGGADEAVRQEEANGAIPPASGTCHLTRAPGTESPHPHGAESSTEKDAPSLSLHSPREVIGPRRPFRIRPSSEEDPHAAPRPAVFPARAPRGPAIPHPPLRPESVTITDSPCGSALSPGEIRPHPCGQSARKRWERNALNTLLTAGVICEW